MSIRLLMICTAIVVLLGGVATAQQGGATSGPAAGSNIEPSTAIQKQDEGRSSGVGQDYRGSSGAAGAPGIEGKPGAESGRAPEGRMRPDSNE